MNVRVFVCVLECQRIVLGFVTKAFYSSFFFFFNELGFSIVPVLTE